MSFVKFEEMEAGVTDIVIKPAKKDPFDISVPKPVTNAEQAEKELLSFDEDYWTAAKLFKRGKNIKDIYDHFKGKYKMTHISYMLDKVINVNTFMTDRDADHLRQVMLSKLDELENVLWNSAQIDPATDLTVMKNHDLRLLLNIHDRRIQLQGLAAPAKVEIDVNHQIDDAKNSLKALYERFKKSKDIIDVTPVESNNN